MKKLSNLLGTFLLFFVVFSFINPARSYADSGTFTISNVVFDKNNGNISFDASDPHPVPPDTNWSSSDTVFEIDIADLNSNLCYGSVSIPESPTSMHLTGTLSSFLASCSSVPSDLAGHQIIFYDSSNTNDWASQFIPLPPTPTPTTPPGGGAITIDPTMQAQINDAFSSVPNTLILETMQVLLNTLPFIIVFFIVGFALWLIGWLMRLRDRNDLSDSNVMRHAHNDEFWNGAKGEWDKESTEV